MLTFTVAEFCSDHISQWACIRNKLEKYFSINNWESLLFSSADTRGNATLYTLPCASTISGCIAVLVLDGYLYYEAGSVMAVGTPSVEIKLCNVSVQFLVENEFNGSNYSDISNVLHSTVFGGGLVRALSCAVLRVVYVDPSQAFKKSFISLPNTGVDTVREGFLSLDDGTLLDILIRTYGDSHIQFHNGDFHVSGHGRVYIRLIRRWVL